MMPSMSTYSHCTPVIRLTSLKGITLNLIQHLPMVLLIYENKTANELIQYHELDIEQLRRRI